MRFGFLFLASVLASSLIGCSSDDPAPTDPGPQSNACIAAGGVCAVNFPFVCAPGFAAEPSRAGACGKSISDDPRDVPCCIRKPVPDTGVPDTGIADASADATDDATNDATNGDANDDAPSDGSDAADVNDAD